MEVVKRVVAGIGIFITVLCVVAFLVLWLFSTTQKEVVCTGVTTRIFEGAKSVYPQSQAGLIFTEPTWVGELIGFEPNFKYRVNAIDERNGGSAVSENDFNLAYSRLTDEILSADEESDAIGRTMLWLDTTNGYVGLSNRLDENGFDFDGFCRNEKLEI